MYEGRGYGVNDVLGDLCSRWEEDSFSSLIL
jgi:hypothetical protein